MGAHVYIVAVESSGDYLGAGLVENIAAQDGSITMSGIGGPAMQSAGVASEMDISGLAILGFVEGLSAYSRVLKKVAEASRLILDAQPDAVVLIDSWGFMIRIAKTLKKAGYKGQIIKYVAPQVWAMREGRSKILARFVDHLLTIHSFDAPYFERHGLPVSYIGNPVLDIDYQSGDGAGLRREFGIGPKDELVGVFFGSRYSEIKTLAKPFADTVASLKKHRPHIRFVSPVSTSIAPDVSAAAAEDMRLQDVLLLPEERKFDVFSAIDVALACSGTVTTQLACAGVPTSVAYKVNALTYFVAKRIFKQDYISIVNIAAQSGLMPEFIQQDATGELLSKSLSGWLNDRAQLAAISKKLLDQTRQMKGVGGNANERAAQKVIELVS